MEMLKLSIFHLLIIAVISSAVKVEQVYSESDGTESHQAENEALKLTKSACAPGTRQKRQTRIEPQLVGGFSTINDINEFEDVKKLAEDSLVSFSAAGAANGESCEYKLKEIYSATKQVVSGALYKIDAKISIGDIEVDCNLKIWSQPWRDDGTELTIKCGEENELKHRYRRPLGGNYPNNKKPKNVYHLFRKYMFKYNKKYDDSKEEKLRYTIFKKNLALIDQLNQMEQATAIYGITEFSDLTPEEYRLRTGLVPREGAENNIRNPIAEIPDIEIPENFDWRDKGAVTEVKDQGSCGSCWAFSVTGNIEGLHFIKTGILEEYSEQELLDCDKVDQACNGGLPDDAYKAIERIGGLELESDYPYRAKKLDCKFNRTLSHVRVKGAVDLPKNETAMAIWLVSNGPISIGINAFAMQFYRGGISRPWRIFCRHSGIDHGVLIVGYGVERGIPYWIVKNSWGRKWGEHGHYRVYRGGNTCGINSMASSAVLYD